MNKEKILEVKNLKKNFSTNSGMLHAVDDVTFDIREGETLGVVGESGCGKSTLGRAVLRLNDPTSGEVIFQGKNILQYGKKGNERAEKGYAVNLSGSVFFFESENDGQPVHCNAAYYSGNI